MVSSKCKQFRFITSSFSSCCTSIINSVLTVIMPLFNKKFDSKPIPSRVARCNIGCPAVNEELNDFRNISINLGNKELRFTDGIWIHVTTRKRDADDVQRLNRRFKALEEENNMCNLKIEVMLDLLAEHATELNELKPKETIKQ